MEGTKEGPGKILPQNNLKNDFVFVNGAWGISGRPEAILAPLVFQ